MATKNNNRKSEDKTTKSETQTHDQKNNDTGMVYKTETRNGKKIFVRHIWWVDALLFIGGTLLLGGLATLLGGKMFNFKDYKMPPGIVPKIVFPIAWSIIYVAIGVSTFLMWRDKEIKEKDRKINLVLYFVHMFFNIMWPLFFFRLDLPIFSCVWLLLVATSAFIVMFRYFLANLPAGIIFTIYSAWLIYALYLNLGLVLLNLV